MLRLLKRYMNLIISVMLLIIPFFFLRANIRSPEKLTPIDRFILKLSAPIQWVVKVSVEWFGDLWSNYIYLIKVKEKNDYLMKEIKRLKEENRRLSSLAEENRRLRNMLEFKENFMWDMISAKVIARDINSVFRTVRVRLDRGEDTVAPGMVVVAPEGLVGEIIRVWSGFSDVMIVPDTGSSIDVEIERTKARGILKGTGGNNSYICKISFLKRDEDVKTGDLVITSGVGRKFPRGILVGTVSKVIKKSFGLYQEVEVEPSVDFSTLSEVFIITTTLKPDYEEREKRAKEHHLILSD